MSFTGAKSSRASVPPRSAGDLLSCVRADIPCCYYDPATAQFLSRDPAVDTTRSPYGYVDGNPLNVTDPGGKMGCQPGAPCDPYHGHEPNYNSLPTCQVVGKGQMNATPCQSPSGAPPFLGSVYQHGTVSVGVCVLFCLSAQFQDGYVSGGFGCCGLLDRGPGIGWSNETPKGGWNPSVMAGGAYYGGLGGSVGLTQDCNGGLKDFDPGNWSVNAFAGTGGYAGMQGMFTFKIPFLP